MKLSFLYILSILKDTSFLRIVNYIAIWPGYWISVIIKKPVLFSQPFALSAEPVRGCNLSCSGCPAGNISGKEIKTIEADLFKRIINDVASHTFYLQLWFQGEPLLHTEIDTLIQYARQKKMFVVIASNGILLNASVCEMLIKSGLSKIIVSINVSGKKSDFNVGGNYTNGKNNISLLSELKKKHKTSFPIIEAQMTVNAENEALTDMFKKEMKACGANKISLKTTWFENLNDINLPVPVKHSRYCKNPDGTWRPKKAIRNKCFRIFSTIVVTYNGDVVPCCFDKNIKYSMGNISEHNLMEIWKSERFNKYRSHVLKNRKINDICRNCTE